MGSLEGVLDIKLASPLYIATGTGSFTFTRILVVAEVTLVDGRCVQQTNKKRK